MAEKLENLVAEGKMVVETQEERTARFAEETARIRAMKNLKEQMANRKSLLKSNIELLELEAEFVEQQNRHAEAILNRHRLEYLLSDLPESNAEMEIKDDQDTDSAQGE